MILSCKLCMNILLEPIKFDIKRTQTKKKSVREAVQMSQIETGIILYFINA